MTLSMPTLSITDIRSFLLSFHREEIHDPSLIRASVLIPLFEQRGDIYFVLTQRTEEVEHHKGQVSFPGGVMDKTDRTIMVTALREAEEEIGLSKNAVEVLGLLNDFRTLSGFCITPIVAFLPSLPSFSINTREVSEVFSIPLSFFLDSRNERVEQREYNNKAIEVFFYHYGNYTIWGATAAMLRAFLYNFIEWTISKKTL
jgi:8-oxo-dGTP pyrophosphatase MutT (NUDIX family)